MNKKIIGVLLATVGSVFLCGSSYKTQEEIITPKIETKTIVQEVPEVSEPLEPIEPIIEYVSLGEFKITAYCPCELCCGKWSDGLTYTGTVATEDKTIAVDPTVIPLGSTVEINGVEYIAEDIGGAIKENRIDVFFENHKDALEWGVQYHNIFLVEFTHIRK